MPMHARRSNAPLAAVLALLVLSIGLAACGSDDSVSQEELQQATEEAAQEARKEVKKEQELDQLREEVEALKKQRGGGSGANAGTAGGTGGGAAGGTAGGAAGGGLPTDAVNCGAGVYARSGTTSCNFALNVASDYFSSPSNSFDSYSPATGKLYRMSCSGAAPVICTGGNNAAVYIP